MRDGRRGRPPADAGGVNRGVATYYSSQAACATDDEEGRHRIRAA
jgi:hypothetical protein